MTAKMERLILILTTCCLAFDGTIAFIFDFSPVSFNSISFNRITCSRWPNGTWDCSPWLINNPFESDCPTRSGFECNATGNFADARSVNCRGYFSCVATPNLVIEAFERTCPTGTIFDSTRQICTRSGTCAAAAVTCIASGNFADVNSADCRGYISCIALPDRTLVSYKRNCTDGTRFNPVSKACDSTYTCRKVSETFQCPGRGSYPNSAVPDCRGYAVCVPDGLGRYSALLKTCPIGTSFNPFSESCDADYAACSAPDCTAQGLFLNPNVADCRGFYLCYEEGRPAEKKLCPDGERFNPRTQTCDSSFACGSSMDPLYCSGVGLFVDYFVADCTGYYRCPRVGMVAERRRCPPATFYNAISGSCERNFVCDLFGGAFACPDAGLFPDVTRVPGCRAYYACAAAGAAGQLRLCPLFTRFDPERGACAHDHVCGGFVCPTAGLYPDSNVNDCEGYYACSAAGVVGERRLCPVGASFNPTTRLCESSYVCGSQSTLYVCSEAGTFPDLLVPGCKGVVVCAVSANLMRAEVTRVTCPGTERFNVVTKVCDPSYFCLL